MLLFVVFLGLASLDFLPALPEQPPTTKATTATRTTNLGSFTLLSLTTIDLGKVNDSICRALGQQGGW